MFTGIIECQGRITRISNSGVGKRFEITADFELDNTKIGDSIAVNGACLTVVEIKKKGVQVDVSPETLNVSTLGSSKIGERVNLERALSLSSRIDGHLVSGHIDGTGSLKGRKKAGNSIIMTFKTQIKLLRYMIVKGSVAVHGISLTINSLENDSFSVSIIPHTAKNTSLENAKIGDLVNIETDMIGKYVERFLDGKKSGVNMELLARNGFLK